MNYYHVQHGVCQIFLPDIVQAVFKWDDWVKVNFIWNH